MFQLIPTFITHIIILAAFIESINIENYNIAASLIVTDIFSLIIIACDLISYSCRGKTLTNDVFYMPVDFNRTVMYTLIFGYIFWVFIIVISYKINRLSYAWFIFTLIVSTLYYCVFFFIFTQFILTQFRISFLFCKIELFAISYTRLEFLIYSCNIF